ncbi:hypothetical protein BGZ90_006007, partial [Linnemannia elongata]
MSVSTSTTTTTATPTMVSSCEHFFDIPELVEHLAQYLVRQDVSRLTRTNKWIHLCYSFLVFIVPTLR